MFGGRRPPRNSGFSIMKEYRLAAWHELRPPYDRIAYRRMLSDMSQRHMTVWQLVASSGLRRFDVQNFIDLLGAQGLVVERERSGTAWLEPLRSAAVWVRRIAHGAVYGD
jgi:hypothetical protein